MFLLFLSAVCISNSRFTLSLSACKSLLSKLDTGTGNIERILAVTPYRTYLYKLTLKICLLYLALVYVRNPESDRE
jgi:hypothetical protein